MNASASRITRKPSADKTPAAIKNGLAKNKLPEMGTDILKNEKKSDERFLSISTATLVSAIENAAGFSKSALHLELAVGLLLFANHGKTDLSAKKELAIVYQQAGYKCATPNDEDYKTVNRRINVAAEFFDWLDGKPTIDEWILATTEMQSIQAIVRHLEDEFNFKGMNSVMATIGKPVILKRDRQRAATKPETGQQPEAEGQPSEQQITSQEGAQTPTAEQQGVASLLAEKSAEAEKKGAGAPRRRSSDRPDIHVIQTAHMRVEIPMEVTKEELIQISTELLMLANTLQVAESPESTVV